MQDIDALMNMGRPPEGDRKPEERVSVPKLIPEPKPAPEKKPEPKPKKMTEVERLEARRKREKEQGKKTTAKLAKARRAEKRKAEQAAKKKRQDKAEAFLAYCENTEVTVAATENGQTQALQLYDYIVWAMWNEGKALP